MKRNGMLAILTAMIAMALGSPARAQQQAPPEQKPPEKKQETSVAEAARKAREQKGTPAKPTRVFTNDNLPSGTTGVSMVGSGAGGTGEAGAAAEGTAAGEASAEGGVDEAEVQKLRERVDALKKELDLLMRDFNLRNQQFSSNPGYMRDAAGKAALDQLEAQKNAKQQELADAEAQLKEMESKRRAAPAAPVSPEKAQQAMMQKAAALREELARVEAEMERIRAEAAKNGQTLYGTTASGGGFTADMLAQMEKRRAELQKQIADLEEEARRAGAKI